MVLGLCSASRQFFELAAARSEERNAMECVLCRKTSTEVAIEPLSLGTEARRMLQKQFGIDPDEVFANEAICRECLALPFGERKKMAVKAIKDGRDEQRRDLIKELKNRQN